MAIDIETLKKQWKEIGMPSKRVQAPPLRELDRFMRSPSLCFDDEAIPIGERKKRFMKWILNKKGMTERRARIICARFFHREESES